MLLLSGACAGKLWARAGSQVSVFKARLDSWEQACTGPSTSILGNITLERQLVSLFPEMSQKSVKFLKNMPRYISSIELVVKIIVWFKYRVILKILS